MFQINAFLNILFTTNPDKSQKYHNQKKIAHLWDLAVKINATKK